MKVTGRPEDLGCYWFGDRPYAEAVLAELDGTVAGMALYFYNFSISHSIFRMGINHGSLYFSGKFSSQPYLSIAILLRIFSLFSA